MSRHSESLNAHLMEEGVAAPKPAPATPFLKSRLFLFAVLPVAVVALVLVIVLPVVLTRHSTFVPVTGSHVLDTSTVERVTSYHLADDDDTMLFAVSAWNTEANSLVLRKVPVSAASGDPSTAGQNLLTMSLVKGEPLMQLVIGDASFMVNPGAVDAVTRFEIEQRLNALADDPHFMRLPVLSMEIGQQGYHGEAYPGTVLLHLIASRVSTRAGVFLPPRPTEAPSHGAPRTLMQQFMCTSVNTLMSGPATESELLNCNSNGWPLTESECSNSCYTMCGPTCTCWYYVCGDCCGHPGCQAHDNNCNPSYWNFACMTGEGCAWTNGPNGWDFTYPSQCC